MAGKRKAEGIALLSVYAGSDDEDDAASQSSAEDAESPSRLQDVGILEIAVDAGAQGPVRAAVRVRGAGLGIVDYAQDDSVASPEPLEEETVDEDGAGVLDGELRVDNGNLLASPSINHGSTPSKMATPKGDNDPHTSGATGPGDGGGPEAHTERQDIKQEENTTCVEHDILDEFFPPPALAEPSEELQSKFSKYLALKKTGKSLNEQLRNTKGYRNPDFLQRAVKYHEIDQHGSCFRKEVFDPNGFDPVDFYDRLAAEQRREAERKEQERKQSQSQRVDFVRAGIQAAVGVAKPAIPLIHKGVTTTTTITTTTTTETTTIVKVESRSSKKSKWDKVEVEVKSAQSVAVDALAAVLAHASVLSSNVRIRAS